MPKILTTLCVAMMVLGYTNAVAQDKAQAESKMIVMQAPCGEADKMVNLTKKHDEQVLFLGEGITFAAGTGRSLTGGMIFTVNQDTGTWTMFQLYGDGVACMLMNGGNFQPYMGD